MTSEKELWESKYEQKRKALKEVESTLGKKVIELERINNVQENQLLKEKADLEALKESHQSEIVSLKDQLQNLD